MTPNTAARADMHGHSTASELSRLGVQRSVGLPECATPPDEVYELAKRRGMDFVTQRASLPGRSRAAGRGAAAPRRLTAAAAELATGGLAAARQHSWAWSLEQLAAFWSGALAGARAAGPLARVA